MQNLSHLSENISTSFFNYIIILFVCLPLYLWKLQQKSSIFTWVSIILSEMLYKIISFIRKCLHFLFNYMIILFLCLSLILHFSQISTILSDNLCNHQFYHTYFRWKHSSLHFHFLLKKILNVIHYLMLFSILS